MMGESRERPLRERKPSLRSEELSQLLERHHGVTVADVLRTIRYLRDDGDCVIAGGSLAFGLGNHLSDLDIVVAGGGTSESSRVPLEHFVASLRVDVWKMNRKLIDDVFARASNGLDGTARLHQSFANVDDETNLKLLHRISFGVLLDGPELTPACDGDHRQIARELVLREYVERMRESALLAQLALEFEDFVAATLNARLAVEEALHTTVAARGLPFTGDKWLRERLEHDAPDLVSMHDQFASLPELVASAVSVYVAAAIEMCGNLTGLTLEQSALAAQVMWEADGVEMLHIGQRPLLVAPATGAMWTLDADEDTVWKELDMTATTPHRWACTPEDRPATALSFRLHSMGIARVHWTHGQPVSAMSLPSGGMS